MRTGIARHASRASLLMCLGAASFVKLAVQISTHVQCVYINIDSPGADHDLQRNGFREYPALNSCEISIDMILESILLQGHLVIKL